MTAKEMVLPLASYFNWSANRIIPQFAVDGGIADLVVITKAGYLIEVEIKVSQADWKADAEKNKWQRGGEYVQGVWTPASADSVVRPTVSRFFYAVPEELAGRPPENLIAGAGILAVGRFVNVVRPATRTKASKLELSKISEMLTCFYFRWWRREFKQIKEEHANLV